MFITDLFEATAPMHTLVIYPGRFQPWHKGHRMVYEHLVKLFGRDNVFIATSNKVDAPRSPFSFSEKVQFMNLTGVSLDRIVETRDPYRAIEVVQNYNPSTTRLIFAVSEKDMAEDPRFKFGTKRDGTPTYFQPLPKDANDMQSLNVHGYIMTVPTFNFTVLGEPMKSATEVRAQFAQADTATQQTIIKDLFGAYDRHVHDIMKQKLSQAITESIAVGSKLDLTKNYGNFETLIGVVKDITPSGKLKIQIAQAQLVPGKKGAVRVGDVVTVASNYVKGTVLENFADGKNPQDKGDSKRHGVPTKASVSTLRKVAKQGGRKGQLAHWMANMKAGKAKAKNEGSAVGLNEFAPGAGGGESGRWYTDDQMTDIVGDGWWQDLDISGNIPKQAMIQEAQAWLDDQGYNVRVLNCKLNDDDMEWYIEGSFNNPNFAKKGMAEGIEEDPLDLRSDYALYIANAGRHMMIQLTNLSKKIQTDSAAAQNAKRWNLGDYMHQHYETDDMSAINQVFEEYGVGGLFDQNLYELLANWSSQGSEYVTTWKQYSSDVIMNSNRKPGAQSVHEQGVAETINLAVRNKRFNHTQVIGDYTYKASAEWFGRSPLLYIRAYDGDKQIGEVMFEIITRSPGGKRDPSADYLESGGTEVEPEYRNKGVASTMYAYAKMLGNDIRPSYNQWADGKAMWAAWEKSGDAKHLIGTAAESIMADDDSNLYRRPTAGEANRTAQQTQAKLNPTASKFVWKKPNQIGGSFSEQDLISKGFKKSQYNSWGGTQAMWNRLTTVGEQLDRPTPTAQQILDKHNLSVEDFIAQLKLGVKVELEHTKDAKTAYEIALDHLNERPDYYTVLAKTGLEEAASGYIPTAAEKDDPRFKTALTVDVRPGTDKKNMRALRLIK